MIAESERGRSRESKRDGPKKREGREIEKKSRVRKRMITKRSEGGENMVERQERGRAERNER